jgi:aspartyl-tRNA(Asn)/glutamyl-tRNA(Gln) amidotransferase subunit C
MEQTDIRTLAALARIAITDAEAEALKKDIESVLAYVSVVREISGSTDTTSLGAVANVFRQDVVTNEPNLYTETLLAEAPDRDGRYLKVKKILNVE